MPANFKKIVIYLSVAFFPDHFPEQLLETFVSIKDPLRAAFGPNTNFTSVCPKNVKSTVAILISDIQLLRKICA